MFESVVYDGYPLGVFVVVHTTVMVGHHEHIVDITHAGLNVCRPNLREQLTVDVHLVRCPLLLDRHETMVMHLAWASRQVREYGPSLESKVLGSCGKGERQMLCT